MNFVFRSNVFPIICGVIAVFTLIADAGRGWVSESLLIVTNVLFASTFCVMVIVHMVVLVISLLQELGSRKPLASPATVFKSLMFSCAIMILSPVILAIAWIVMSPETFQLEM